MYGLNDPKRLPEEERAFIPRAEKALADGRRLKDWWTERYEASPNGKGVFRDRFTLIPDRFEMGGAWGFFDDARIDGKTVPVMGEIQEIFFDTPKETEYARLAEEVQEFALRYCLRVSEVTRAQLYPEDYSPVIPDFLGALNWNPSKKIKMSGMGISQLHYKWKDSDRPHSFDDEDRRRFVDLRRFFERADDAADGILDWVILQAEVFDFSLEFPVRGLADVVFPAKQQPRAIISQELITNDENEFLFGPGFYFIDSPEDGFFAFGPEKIQPGFLQYQFGVREREGRKELYAREIFVTRQPEAVFNVSWNPIEVGFKMANMASLGLAGNIWRNLPFTTALRDVMKFMNPGGMTANPISLFVGFMDLATRGRAASERCISKEQVYKNLLVKHSFEHHRNLLGVLQTWNQVASWADAARIPNWVVKGEPRLERRR